MKVLVIGESFFGYIERIRHHFQKLNIDTNVFYTYLPSSVDRAKRQFFKKEFDARFHYQKLFSFKIDYDLILIINGKNLPNYFIDALQKFYPTTRKILYVWDDLKNLEQTDYFFSIFDQRYTYSRLDADLNRGFEFLPFFYTNKSNIVNRNIDASFIGTLHSDRHSKLHEIKKNNSEINFYNYLYSDFITYLKFMKKVNFNEVKFKSLDYSNYISMVACSKALIELPHPDQSNITTRAIEVLGTKTKLITTSVAVKMYDFYTPKNIFILTEENSEEITDWLKEEYDDYPVDLTHKYFITNWLHQILK